MRSLGKFPDPFITEIAGQPDALRRAAAALLGDVPVLRVVAEARVDRRVVFTGMGASYDACYPAVTELAQAGIAAAMLDASELLHFRTATLGKDTLLVAVSQSGESAEMVRLVADGLRAVAGPVVVAVTNGVDNTLARLADHVLDTGAGHETGPSTMTFGAALVTVAGLGRVIAGVEAGSVAHRLGLAAEVAAESLERLLDDVELPDELADWFGSPDTAVILGRGSARAAAEMGALTVKEAAGLPIEALQTAQFRHGPLELVGPGLSAIVIATEPETSALDLGLALELADADARVLVVTPTEVVIPGARVIATGVLDRALSSAVSIAPIQLIAWRLAVRRGRSPGAYYRAAKVTTRE